MGIIICSKCERTLKEGEEYVPFVNPFPQFEGFKIYGLTFLNFCLNCAKKLNIKVK